MTVDRDELRRLSEGITPLGCPPRMDVACRLAAAVPALLNELDAKDRRIAELEAGLREALQWHRPLNWDALRKIEGGHETEMVRRDTRLRSERLEDVLVRLEKLLPSEET